MSDLFEPQITDLIACVEREIKLRHRVYPRRIAAGHMGQALADREIRLMTAVLRTLQRIRDDARTGVGATKAEIDDTRTMLSALERQRSS